MWVKLVALNIRRLADERGMRLVHLADRAGVGRTTMWRILDTNDQGPSNPRLSTIEALADELGVGPLELLRPADDND